MPRSTNRVAAAPRPAEVFGASVPRREAPQKVRGTAVYADDVPLPVGGVWVRTVRSPLAHGLVRGMRFGEGIDWSRITVIDHRSIPGSNHVQHILADQQALAAERVRHREEAVLLLAAEDRELLERAVRAVKLDIEPLPAVFTPAESRRGDVRIFGEDNVFKHVRIARGDARAALESAPVRVRGRYTTPAQEHAYLEPHAVVAEFIDGTLVVRGTMQCPYYVHKALVPLLGLPPEKVRVIQTETGGGFGGKEDYPSVIACHAALAAHVTGRPAKILYDREEDMLATTKRHPCEVEIEAGFSQDGKLLALFADVAMNGGAYSTMSPVVLSRGALHAAGAYECENVLVEAAAYATNLVPFGAFRGFGAPQTLFAIEAHMDACAERLGIDPLELRRRNVMRPGSITSTGQNLGDDAAGRDVLEECVRLAQWDKRRAEAEKHNRAGGRTRRGVGVSVVLHGSGFTGNGEVRLASKVKVDTLPDGTVRALCANTEMGQGRNTVLAQIVAQELGLEPGDVIVPMPDTAVVPNSGPTVASRTTMVIGGLLRQAAERLRANLETATGRSLRSRAAFRDAVKEAHTRGEHPSAMAQYQAPPGVSFDEDAYTGSAYGTYAWMGTVADVEVDLVTYEARVREMWIVPECGSVVNPLLASGQVEGGALQATGWALTEDVVWRDGTMANSQLTNYIVPTSADAPRIHVAFIERPYAAGPFGAKGLGELPMDGPAGAIAGAIRQAIGVLPHDLPMNPERLATLVENAR